MGGEVGSAFEMVHASAQKSEQAGQQACLHRHCTGTGSQFVDMCIGFPRRLLQHTVLHTVPVCERTKACICKALWWFCDYR